MAIENRPYPETQRDHARLNLLWALGQIDDPLTDGFLKAKLQSPNDEVTRVAAHYLSLRRSESGKWAGRQDEVLRVFEKLPASARRAIIEWIGRTGDVRDVPRLTTLAKGANSDRFLEHSLIYALVELGDVVHPDVASKADPQSTRMALIALDQMPNGGLKPEEVAKHLTSPEPLLRETSAWIISRHADWGEALAGYLRERLAAGELTDAEQKTLGQQLAQFAKAASVQELLAATVRDGKLPSAARLTALGAMRDSKLKELPKNWSASLLAVLGVWADAARVGENDFELIELAVKTARAIPPHKDDAAAWRAPLLIVAGPRRGPESGVGDARLHSLRLDALAALPGGLTANDLKTNIIREESQPPKPRGLTADELKAHPELFDFVLSQLTPELPVAQRGTAAEVISKAKLTPAQLTKLTEQFATAGPLEVDRLLGAFEQSTDEQVGQQLIAALKTAPALTALRPDAIKTRLAKYSPSVQEAAQPLYAALNVDLGKQRQQLEEMLASLPPGDIVRGQKVFHNEKAACKACHALGYLGGKTGPDLTRIGGIRNERDLLESILFPSASFVRSFEPVLIVTTNGKTVNGLIRSETPDELVIATGPNKEERVTRADIEEMRPSSVSIMPPGLEKQITLEQLADLIAFLKNCK